MFQTMSMAGQHQKLFSDTDLILSLKIEFCYLTVADVWTHE